MSYYNFNPFGKDLNQIEAADLATLCDVSEGWYIDYKQEIIDIKKIAKHASAFANQYGGWLFFGITESDRKTAEKFIGIKIEDVQKLSTAIRESVSTHSNPEVYYEEKIIYGPDDTIKLHEHRAIVIVYIPEGTHPPYIHSSGKIYRRVSDHSDPKAETDRHLLDRLWQKNEKISEQLKHFLNNRANFKITTPVAYIHLLTDRYFEKRFDLLEFEEFKKAVVGTKDGGISIPMNTFYSARGGFIARQTKGNNPLFPVVSLRWWHTGAALLTIPLNYYDTNSFLERYSHSENSKLFISEVKKQQLGDAKICDLDYMLFVLAGLYNQFKQILYSTKNFEKVYATIQIENTFQSLTFIDDNYYVKRISEHGVPLVLDEHIQIPDIVTINNLIELSKKEYAGEASPGISESVNALLETLPISVPILFAFGVLNEPSELDEMNSIFDLTKYVKP